MSQPAGISEFADNLPQIVDAVGNGGGGAGDINGCEGASFQEKAMIRRAPDGAEESDDLPQIIDPLSFSDSGAGDINGCEGKSKSSGYRHSPEQQRHYQASPSQS